MKLWPPPPLPPPPAKTLLKGDILYGGPRSLWSAQDSSQCLSFNISFAPDRRRQWHPTPVLLPGKSHGQRSPVGCSPWGCWGSDTTEQLHFHFSLSYIGEGNGNPLQCSCLENPRDGGTWWAAVYGVAQSRTRPKQLSSSMLNNIHRKEKQRVFMIHINVFKMWLLELLASLS